MKRNITALALVAIVISLAGCSTGNEALLENEEATDRQLEHYNKVQPVPFFPYSAYRETLRSLQDAQANGLATTTFFFGMNTENPVSSCASVGYPVPSTAQLTSPDQIVRPHSGGEALTVAQMEPTGVYTGDSTGTYVVCIRGGMPTVEYWEGFVYTVGGPAEWDPDAQQVVTTGDSTVTVDVNGSGQR